MSKQRKIPTPSWERHGGVMDSSRARIYATVGVVLLVVAAVGLIGFGYLNDWIQDQQRPGSTAVKVDDRNYTVNDFTERAKMYVKQNGGSGQAALVIPTLATTLIEESILLTDASEKGVESTDDEVKAEMAKLLGITADDANFDSVLQSELDSSGLSKEEYTDMARANVLREKTRTKFQEELPATADSVHFLMIQVRDQALADDLKVQIDGGADFAALAAANSIDPGTKDKGGDAGWVPRGVLLKAQEDLLFSLDAGETAVYPGQGSIYIYKLLEKDAAHAVDETQKPVLATTEYTKWVTDKKDAAKVTNDLDFSSGDAKKIKYVVTHANLTIGQ